MTVLLIIAISSFTIPVADAAIAHAFWINGRPEVRLRLRDRRLVSRGNGHSLGRILSGEDLTAASRSQRVCSIAQRQSGVQTWRIH